MEEQLAILGGRPVITSPLRPYNPIGEEEIRAVTDVMRSGVLSKFIGAWGPDFFGGPKVKEFERACQTYLDTGNAVSVNSATSGLIAVLGAIGLEPGDEVVVTPWTMCATATAIVHWNAVPVFADIESETFCLNPRSVEANVTPRTKAILAVDIFGHSSDVDALRAIADKHGLKLITDTAQAPGARYKGKFAGTVADAGVFSLNYHKHIHTGEGGLVVTNDAELAERLRLIRNHAEAVVEEKGTSDLRNMIGFNFRMGEIEAAIGIEQLKKLNALVASRQRAAERLTSGLGKLKGLRTPMVRPDCSHVYYVYPLVLVDELSNARNRICDALRAEGVPISGGYQNLHRLPMYKQKIAYGSAGFPWKSPVCSREVSYHKGVCPVAEQLHDHTFLSIGLCSSEFSDAETDLVVEAFNKVWENMNKVMS